MSLTPAQQVVLETVREVGPCDYETLARALLGSDRCGECGRYVVEADHALRVVLTEVLTELQLRSKVGHGGNGWSVMPAQEVEA